MPFRTALSGLNASSAELRVIGNNVANASTTGFKKSRAEFSDVFAVSSTGTSNNTIGSGVRVASVAQQFTQGNIGFTDNNLDLAISGQGFFMMNDNGTNVYSRAGNFGVDRDGYVVNSQNQRLRAFTANSSGTITGAVDDLQLNLNDIPPQTTATVVAGINLNAAGDIPLAPIATTRMTESGTLNNAQAVGVGPVTNLNSHTSITQTVFDEYGGAHTAVTHYLKTVENAPGNIDTWQSRLYIDGVDVDGATHTLNFNNVTGAISSIDGVNGQTDLTHNTFNAVGGATLTMTENLSTLSLAGANAITASVDGKAQGAFDVNDATSYSSSTSLTVYDSLGSPRLATMYYRQTGIPNQWDTYTYIDGNQVDGPDVLNFDSAGRLSQINGVSTPPSTIATPTFSPGGGAAAMSLNLDYTNLTQYGSPFSVNALTQDGFATGRLSGIDISETGVVLARFTNGQSQTLAQVALADFSNSQGLRQLGDSNWAESFDSGAALVGVPGTASLGLLQSGALEGSNVDLTEQLVGMITAQRNFQANAQVISTADTITQSIINIR